jgi:ATP-dependent exoDNAse (exonuclease V) beta subunit
LLAGSAPDGAPLDPAAQVPWTPLSPRGDEEGEPRVELLLPDASAAPRYPEQDDEEDRGRDDDVEAPLVRRVRALLADAVAGGSRDEAPVAVLTHSWDRAVYYGRLLREHGVPAFVHGGRGLLDAREIRDLLHWLVALERQDDDLSFAALLRGATVGVSDPGLYCLRRGHGLELRDVATGGSSSAAPSTRLARLRNGFRFDAREATAALRAERGSALPRAVEGA